MALTGKELREWDLTQTIFRGYKIAEVDDVMEQAAQTLDELNARVEELSARVAEHEAREQRVDDMEQTLRDTLLTAQRAAEDVVQASREKAAAILADSDLEGRRIIEQAEEAAHEARLHTEALEAQAANVKSMLRRLISDQLRLLEEDFPEGREPARPAEDRFGTREFSLRDVRVAQGLNEPAWQDGHQLEEHGQV